MGLHDRYYGIFRGGTKGREREGSKRRDMGIAWPVRGEQDRAVGAACACMSAECVCAGLRAWPWACVYCIRVFACAPVGNTCSALLLAGPGDM